MQEVFFLGLPVSFILFALTLLGVAVLHRHVLAGARAGLNPLLGHKMTPNGFCHGPGPTRRAEHLGE